VTRSKDRAASSTGKPTTGEPLTGQAEDAERPYYSSEAIAMIGNSYRLKEASGYGMADLVQRAVGADRLDIHSGED
jgi:hypothetical protein